MQTFKVCEPICSGGISRKIAARCFFTLLMLNAIGIFLLAQPALAQGTEVKRVIYFGGASADRTKEVHSRLVSALARNGHVAGVHFSLDAMTTLGDRSKLAEVAQRVVDTKPFAIYAGSWDAADTLRRLTTEIPIVFQAFAELNGTRFEIVKNPLSPEANLTGFTHYKNLVPKKLEYLKRSFSATKRVGFVYGIDILPSRADDYARAAKTLGIDLVFRRIDQKTLPALAAHLNGLTDDAFLIAHDDLLLYNRVAFIEQLSQVRKPLIYPEAATEKGVLMHYRATIDGEAKAAEYLSKLLRGAKIRDLAVQDPQEVDLSVNMTTLRRLGLSIPNDVLTEFRKVD